MYLSKMKIWIFNKSYMFIIFKNHENGVLEKVVLFLPRLFLFWTTSAHRQAALSSQHQDSFLPSLLFRLQRTELIRFEKELLSGMKGRKELKHWKSMTRLGSLLRQILSIDPIFDLSICVGLFFSLSASHTHHDVIKINKKVLSVEYFERAQHE